MEKKSKKCSLKHHTEIEAISHCQQCKIYMCFKCEKVHSELCQNHIPYSLNKDIDNIFTGICKIENHSNDLEYFCKDHNQLCCASCITKIKGNNNGQHTDCNVCYIEEIKDEKKNKLNKNIQDLEKLSNTIEDSILELKKLFEKKNQNIEKLKTIIQIVFAKIRNEINDREDELLLEVDKKYDELYFKEDLLKKGEKLPKKIKESIKHGKESYEKPLNLKFLINDCLNIENDIKDINIIKENINKCNDIESEIKFSPEENEKNLNEFLLNIKNFGSFSYYDKKEKNKNKSDTVEIFLTN